MKKIIVRTRWEYYVANVAGILSILAVLIWFFILAITDEGLDFTSVFFWSGLLLLCIVPYTLIGFLSSMKTVEVTTTELTISYVFKNHTNEIHFSDVAEMKASKTEPETKKHSRSIRDTFKLILTDGRVFEFDRSQFDKYAQLKTICRKSVKG